MRLGQEVQEVPRRLEAMAETTETVEERLQEIGTQLAWVRDYL
jgi:hypothetical protein